MAARFSLALATFFLSLAAAGAAQQLQRLHVRSFTLTTDTAHPKLEEPFNVTLTIRLAGNVGQLENVYLPTFIGPEELGDVREQSSGSSGTLYRETLRLVAHARGPLTIGSAYLEAIDARDGRPKRFISGDLHLYVTGGPAVETLQTLRRIAPIALIAFVFAAVLLWARFGRRKAVMVKAKPAPQPPLIPAVRMGPSEFEIALAQVRNRRDRDAVMRLRRALWHIAGASEGLTLAAALRRPECRDGKLRGMLAAVERAAFIDADRLQTAIDAVLAIEQREETPA